MSPAPGRPDRVGLVLAGGGARGAYEMGALPVLLPALDAEGHRPRVVVGTSVGALNAAFLAATAHQPVSAVVEAGRAIWSGLRWEQVLEPLASPGSLGRAARYLGQALGVPGARLEGLLDPRPLRQTLLRAIDFARLEANVRDGVLDAAAVVATSAATGRSVVFHRGGTPPAHDGRRGIDYVNTPLGDEHVRASAAIPAVFPAVHVASPPRARGWYLDGGTRLNTPIKPLLALGVERVVVVALNSIAPAPPQLASDHRPDALEGGAQLAQALLVDPLVQDVQSLAKGNRLGAMAERALPGARVLPYLVVAPETPDAIGRLAREVFADRYAGLRGRLRSGDLATLGHALDGGSDPAHGELLSYLLFAPEFAEALQELGARDARAHVAAGHADGLWEV